MIAYNGDESLKAAVLAEIGLHREEDRIWKQTYGDVENGQWHGCAVACTLRSLAKLGVIDGGPLDQRWDNHQLYEAIGVPAELAHVEDAIFEELSVDEGRLWPERFASAIVPGRDLGQVLGGLVDWMEAELAECSSSSRGTLRVEREDLAARLLEVEELPERGHGLVLDFLTYAERAGSSVTASDLADAFERLLRAA